MVAHLSIGLGTGGAGGAGGGGGGSSPSNIFKKGAQLPLPKALLSIVRV